MKTKEKVLKLLSESRGEFLSGQQIADTVFVTRAAVWKSIKALQEEGYTIDAVTNKGYRLKFIPDMISVNDICVLLGDLSNRIDVLYFDEVGSTNDVALNQVRNTDKDCLVIASAQTSGRGRRGRSFYSPQNSGLYMSLALKMEKSISDYASVTAISATATARAIDNVIFNGVDTSKIKWVNDIFLNELKISGILTEAFGSLEDPDNSYLVIGIGINIYWPEKGFPKELRGIAGCVMSREVNKEANEKGNIRSQLAASIVRYLYRYLYGDALLKEECLNVYRQKSFLIGSYIKINSFDGNYKYAYVTGITNDYHLKVRYDDNKIEELTTGEVSVVKY